MRAMLHGLAAVLVLAAASDAFAERRGDPPELQLAKLLEGRTAGKPVNCINQRSIDSVQIIDRTAIVYRMAGGALYVNRVRGGAAFLDRDDTLVTKTTGSQLCDLDIVTLVDPSARITTGSVNLGQFVPYPKPGR